MVVDIIPYDHRILLPAPNKKQNLLTSLILGKKHNSAKGGSNRLSAVGAVEELFEEGSAMLAERYLPLQFFRNFNSYAFSCRRESCLIVFCFNLYQFYCVEC